MTSIIRTTLFAIITLSLSGCLFFDSGTPSPDASLLADQPVFGLVIQVKNSTDVFNTAGQIINYNYIVTYTGAAPLNGPVTVADPQSPVVCPDLTTVGNLDAVLNQNETVICASSYSITPADLTAGSVTKTGTASAGGISSNVANLVTTIAKTQTLTLTKSANPVTYNQIGQVITYTYIVKNSGTTPLGPTQFVITDDHISGPINCGANTLTLLPTESVTCTANYAVGQGDLNAALVTNNATVSGAGIVSQSVSATINNSNTPQVAPPAGNFSPGSTIQHTVAGGEWLLQIARCYGANFNDVLNANTQIADPDLIYASAIVTIPRIGSVGKVYGPPCVVTHTVQSGETWESIAQRYNADVVVLRAANPGGLAVGSLIKVPNNSLGYGGVSVGATVTPSITVTPTITLTPTLTPTVTLTVAAGTGPTRITFAQGATSATINGAVDGSGAVQYVVAGTAGQAISVTLNSTPANQIAWGVYNPSGSALRQIDASPSWNGTLAETGDVRIDVSGIGTGNKTFSLTVSLTGP